MPVLPDYDELMLDSLRAAVGGEQALAHLDDRPLADEAFDPSALPGAADGDLESEMRLGSPEFLIARRRREIIERREHYRSAD